MEVILLERIGKLGQMGDVVTVKDGYARNFLLPQKKALRANKGNLAQFESQRAQLEARNLELKTEAQQVADKMNGESFTVIRQAGDTGQLYGSVSTRDIAEAMTAGGFSAERRQVMLDRPIKMLGLHEMKIQLHPEVEAGVTVNVARTEEEAIRQAAGEDVTVDRDDDDDDLEDNVEEVFEDETLASEAKEDLAAADDVKDAEPVPAPKPVEEDVAATEGDEPAAE